MKHTLTKHAAQQALAKGWTLVEVIEAADHPLTSYANGRYANQMRHIRNNIVAIVDTVTGSIITVYANVVETDLRPDQKDKDALAYGRRRLAR